MPLDDCRLCLRPFSGVCKRRRVNGAECIVCCALIRDNPLPFESSKMRKTEEKKLREDPAAQRDWDMQAEAKINNTTPNGKVKKSLSSGSLSTEAGGPSTSARKTIVDASSVAEAGARGRSPGGESRSTERRPRRRVRDRSISSRGSRSSNERIKKKKKSAIVGHTVMGVFWPMVELTKQFKGKTKPRIKRGMKYNGLRGVALYLH